MPQIGQPPWPESAARAQGSLVELIYPVSFEARLLEARARRAAAITRRSPVEVALSDRHLTPGGQTFEKKAGRPTNGAGWRTMPLLKPALILPNHVLFKLLDWLSRRAPLDERVRWTAARARSGAVVLFLGFAVGVVVARAALVTAPASFWEWAAGIQPATSSATATSRVPTIPFETANPHQSPLHFATLENRVKVLPEVAAIPMEIPVPDMLPAPRVLSVTAMDWASESAFLGGAAAAPPVARVPTQLEALPAIAAIPSPTFPAEGSEMPSDILLGSFAALSVPAMPAENFTQIAIVFPNSDLAGFEFARIEALAPQDTASGPGKVSTSTAPTTPPAIEPAAVSIEAARLRARPTLRLATALPENHQHSTVVAMVGDSPLSDGGVSASGDSPRAAGAGCADK